MITTLSVLCELIKKCSKELKIKGITATTLSNLQSLWKETTLDNQAIRFFEQQMEQYVGNIQANFIDFKQAIPCCSDVIESQYGSYKRRGNKKGAEGFTDDVKVVALYNQRYDAALLSKAASYLYKS